jgi:hypothetical protein
MEKLFNAMISLDDYLKLDRCPHCLIDKPNLRNIFSDFQTTSDDGKIQRNWRAYVCARCGGVITAYCTPHERIVRKIFPTPETVDAVLPEKVRNYLQQAIESTFAPAGSVMLCASAVDAMLKEKGFIEGNLFSRINKAVSDGLLTKEMATWAHQVRLEANDQRHADIEKELPTIEEAKQSIEFTRTLAEFLFVLPQKVTRGIEATKQ